MSDQSLQGLERELALERAARQELERQTVLKTRQLWQLREQQDKEVQQYQEQLSVLRTSLILAHKQQHQQHADPYDSMQQASPEPKQAAAAPVAGAVPAIRHLQAATTPQPEDASPTKADQHKAARQLRPSSPQKLKAAISKARDAGSGPGTPAQATGTPQDNPVLATAVTSTDQHQAQAAQQEDRQQEPQQQQDQQQQSSSTLETAEQLLAAASKVQTLVELLSASEPSAAADLSVLQWQLTAIYGTLTCSTTGQAGQLADGPNSSNNDSSTDPAATPGLRRNGVLQGVSCTGSDPLSGTCSPAADKASLHGKALVLVDAATGTSPLRDTTPDTAAAAAAAASDGNAEVGVTTGTQPQLEPVQQHQQQQEQDLQAAARVAAAAQLFSGAANNSGRGGSKLVSASLSWYYLEPGDPPVVKGPYDAGLMLRWYLKGFLDAALRIAGVVQQQQQPNISSTSSRTPPASLEDFQPLGQLLQQVQQGQGYTPAKPAKQQPASPASKLSQPQQQQLPLSRSLGRFEPVRLSAADVGVMDAGGAAGDGILAKGGSLLAETVGWWLNAAASAQLPGSVSVVDIIEKVINSVAAPAALK